MKKYIENLKTKSHSEKSRFAFFTSLILTSIIAGIWFLTIFANPQGYFDIQPTEAENLANTGSLFDVIKGGLK